MKRARPEIAVMKRLITIANHLAWFELGHANNALPSQRAEVEAEQNWTRAKLEREYSRKLTRLQHLLSQKGEAIQ